MRDHCIVDLEQKLRTVGRGQGSAGSEVLLWGVHSGASIVRDDGTKGGVTGRNENKLGSYFFWVQIKIRRVDPLKYGDCQTGLESKRGNSDAIFVESIWDGRNS